MSIVLAEGVVEVTADGKAIGKDLSKDLKNADVSGAGDGIGKKVFGGVVAAWGAIGAAEAIGGWVAGAITGSSDLNETLSKSQAIFGDQMSTMQEWAATADRTVGLSKSAALDAAAGFGDMFTQIGFTGDAAAQMSTSVVQAAADLGSFSNLDTADVADRMAAAFRGEYDSLQAVIPNINAARVESEALAMTGKRTAKEITAQEKAAAVLAIVQKDGARAMGDFEKTSGSAANQQKILTAQMENQQQKLGGLLLPAWGGFLSILNNGIIPALSTAVEWVLENGTTVGLLAGTVLGAVVAYQAINGALALYKAYQIASAAATGGMTVAQWALNGAMSANPIGLVVTALAALVAGIIWVATQTTFFQDAWAWMTETIGGAATWLWESVLSPVFTAIGDALNWVWHSVLEPVVTGFLVGFGIVAGIAQWLYTAAIKPVFDAIGGVFNWIYNSVIMPVASYISKAITGLGLIFRFLYNGYIRPAFNAVGSVLNGVWTGTIRPVFNAIGNAVKVVGDTVRNIFGGIGDFIGSAFQSALSVIRGPINGIIGLVNGAINGINSLSVTIPDWVPVVGGQRWGLSIPTIPYLARGSASAPGAFIAGEAGPELIVGMPGARVYPADQTRRMTDDKGGDVIIEKIEIIDSKDPIGAPKRIARELKKYKGAGR